MKQTIKDAIQESIQRNISVTVEANINDVVKVAQDAGYETEYTEDGENLDIWGWTSVTPENEQDWRLLVVPEPVDLSGLKMTVEDYFNENSQCGRDDCEISELEGWEIQKHENGLTVCSPGTDSEELGNPDESGQIIWEISKQKLTSLNLYTKRAGPAAKLAREKDMGKDRYSHITNLQSNCEKIPNSIVNLNQLCDKNCNDCPIIKHPNSRMLTHVMNKLRDKFGVDVQHILNATCPNMTVCFDCRIDDFCHEEGCCLVDDQDEDEPSDKTPDCRTAFEDYYKANFWLKAILESIEIPRTDDDKYLDPETQKLWDAWQMAWKVKG